MNRGRGRLVPPRVEIEVNGDGGGVVAPSIEIEVNDVEIELNGVEEG